MNAAERLRPDGWLCPWCDRDESGIVHSGRGCQPVDFSLPVHLRVCHWCANPYYGPVAPTPEILRHVEHREQLRAILRNHIRENFSPHRDGSWGLSTQGLRNWAWMQQGAAWIGSAVLGALASLGYDEAEELCAALDDVLAEAT